jgi:hypothetical protein
MLWQMDFGWFRLRGECSMLNKRNTLMQVLTWLVCEKTLLKETMLPNLIWK